MIGVFDSGIGGLTVVRALRKKLPKARILYVGDVARMPYGNKSADTIVEYCREITRYLVSRGAKMIIIACNTASAVATDALREEFALPILDVISPAVREACLVSKKGKIAVLATRGTVASGAYDRSLRAEAKQSRRDRHSLRPCDHDKIVSLACPIFVPLAEEGYAGTAEGKAIVAHVLRPLKGNGVNTVILGCTHYPLLRKEISAVLPMAHLIDSSAVADDASALIKLDPTIIKKDSPGLEVMVTDCTLHFEKLAAKIIGKKIKLKVLSPGALDIRN